MSNTERYIWLGGEMIPASQAKINVLSPTAQFGANVFEGIRCYWNKEDQQLYAFRLKDHYKRLLNSIKMFRLESKFTEQDFQEALIAVVRKNNYRQDIAVRQTIFVDGLGNWAATSPVNMFVAPIEKNRIDFSTVKRLKCCVSSWQRISDLNLSPKIKVGANYINSRMAQMEAIQNGYDSTILMNNNGKIAEGPGACLAIFRNGVLITPPLSASVLESITRETLITLAKEKLNCPVLEKEIDRTELYICDEAFMCGSAMEITPIDSIDGYLVGNGTSPLTQALHKIYIESVDGTSKDYSQWLTPIL